MIVDYWHKIRGFNRGTWLILGSFAGVGFAVFGISATIFNLFLPRLGYGPQFVGLVTGLSWLAYGGFAVPAGAISRWLGARRGMILGLLGAAAGSMLASLAEFVSPEWRGTWVLVTSAGA